MANHSGITGKAFIIAALDFGSTFSGYAYTFKSDYERDRSKLYANRWEGANTPTEKAPTIVLFDTNDDFHSFGFEAESHYANLAKKGAKLGREDAKLEFEGDKPEDEDPKLSKGDVQLTKKDAKLANEDVTPGKENAIQAKEESHKGWRYFRYFKMNLYEKKKGMLRMRLKDDQGRKMPACQVFSAAIKFLADHLLAAINKRTLEQITVHDIEWYLTVPAIWNDGAKQFMQVAAVDAGLPESKVSLALEPEAAAIYISQIGMHKVYTEGYGFDIRPLAVKSKFMVIDLGGGTVDMTFHEVTNEQTINQIQLELDGYKEKGETQHRSSCNGDNSLVEIHAPEGGKWGGNLVNEDLEDFMRTIFTEEVWDQFSKETRYKKSYLGLSRKLELAKKKDCLLSDTVKIGIPGHLTELFRKVHDQNLEKYIDGNHLLKTSVAVKNDKLKIKAAKMVSMFKRSIDLLTKRLRELDETLTANGIDTIVFVGGFSESKVVQEAMKEHFIGRTVIIPEEPSLAVLKGTVMYGFNNQVIRSRIMKHTYGVSVARPFDPAIHPERYRVKGSDGDRAENIFEVLISAGSVVYPGETKVTRTFNGSYSRMATEGEVSIYISPQSEPKFTDEEGCSEVGSVEFSLKEKGENYNNRLVDVTMHFGHTKIFVTVIERATGEVIKSSFNCLN